MSDSDRIGELLVKENLITALQLKNAVTSQRSSGGRLGHELTKLGYIEENELITFLSKQYSVPEHQFVRVRYRRGRAQGLAEKVVTRHQVIPVNKTGNLDCGHGRPVQHLCRGRYQVHYRHENRRGCRI